MKKLFFKIIRITFIYVPIGLIALSILWVLLLKWVPVTYTPLMAIRSWEYRKDDNFHTKKSWTPIEEISSNMILAVMASEDNLFLEHHGLDWKQIRKAMEENKKGKKLRGASTISQQTAKNVFLYPGRSWVRKGLETYFTGLIELFWGKRRIMEVYLNVAEMGKGIYGAEAASEYYFKKPAAKLSRYESALIAAALPSPLRRKVSPPSSYMARRGSTIVNLMYKIEYKGWNEEFKTKKEREKK